MSHYYQDESVIPLHGYCTDADCEEMTDEFGLNSLCAYHRDHPEEGPAR